MSRTIHLVNDHHGILDMPMIRDVANRPVALRPKGLAGSSCECFPDVERHPHVQAVIRARWAHVERAAIVPPPPAAPAPAPAPVTVPLGDVVSVRDDVAVRAAPALERPEPTVKVPQETIAKLAAESVTAEEEAPPAEASPEASPEESSASPPPAEESPSPESPSPSPTASEAPRGKKRR